VAASAVAASPLVTRVRSALQPALPWVVVLWLGGVLVLSLRLASGWVTARRLATVGTRPAPHARVAALARLAARLRVTRPVRVLESAVVQVPAVIGWLRPVILLPASALTGLTPLQLDALLAHELAHVRRHDYVVNLLQTAIETLLFYHPAVWWVSRRVREEREHCCDDLAVAACGDAHFYATALLGMERLRVAAPAFALAAGGGSLMGRIRRLVAPPEAEIFPRWLAGVVVAATLVLAIGGGAGLGGATVVPRPQAALPASPRSAPLGSADTIMSVLVQRLTGDEAEDARAEAAERLRAYPDHAAVNALVRAARGDLADDVRREAVEALGDNPFPAASDSLLTLARTAEDARTRREAVEQLGQRGDPRALETLMGIARNDDHEGVQREAMSALGRLHDGRAFPLLVELARHHQSPDARRKAVEALGELGMPDTTAALLEQIALQDSDSRVQREAVETLGHLGGPQAREPLARLARTHPNEDVRREAVQRYAKVADPETAVGLLQERLANDRSPDVQWEALYRLSQLPDRVGIPALIEAARTHPDRDVRAEARRRVRESAKTR
jgi:HEAT repeat protein/beta-lactamase regulating signal transducer with metallopeptidase domain